jgi:hypothetical protein
MTRLLSVTLLCTCALAVAAQEREVPKDSMRLAIPGCAKDRRFIVAERPGHEPVRSDIREGRRFRLNGKKDLLAEIKKQDGTMIEVTGLVRKQDLEERGISMAGGRVRIGGALPRARTGGSDIGRDSGYEEVVIDVEAWRPLPETCPSFDRQN